MGFMKIVSISVAVVILAIIGKTECLPLTPNILEYEIQNRISKDV